MSTKVVIGPVRLSYLNVMRPKVNRNNGKEEYSAMILIDKSTGPGKKSIKALKKAEKAECEEKWGDSKPNKYRKLLRDGDKKKDLPDGKRPVKLGDEPYVGHFFTNCKTQDQPDVWDRRRETIINPKEIKSGDWFMVSLNVAAYDNESSGTTAYLNGVQFVKSGPPLGNDASTEDDFEVIDDEEDDDDDDYKWDDDDD